MIKIVEGALKTIGGTGLNGVHEARMAIEINLDADMIYGIADVYDKAKYFFTEVRFAQMHGRPINHIMEGTDRVFETMYGNLHKASQAWLMIMVMAEQCPRIYTGDTTPYNKDGEIEIGDGGTLEMLWVELSEEEREQIVAHASSFIYNATKKCSKPSGGS